jgi:hypothetical protein
MHAQSEHFRPGETVLDLEKSRDWATFMAKRELPTRAMAV